MKTPPASLWSYEVAYRLDRFCHDHNWIPLFIQGRVCDFYDAKLQGGNRYKRLRQERKDYVNGRSSSL